MTTTAQEFWRNKTWDGFKKFYTSLNHELRFSYDIQKLIPQLRHSKKVADLGCGDGKHIKMLDEIYKFEKVFVSDINEMFVFRTLLDIPVDKCLKWDGKSYDLNLTIPPEIAQFDTVMMLGIIQYIQSNDRVVELLDAFKEKVTIIKASCYENEEVYVNKYSEELGEEYEAKYRSRVWLEEQMKRIYKRVKVDRLYPKEIDSKWNSTQYLFVGE